jgi:hypothetical protein
VSQAYQNKVEVAEYYTITKGQGGASAAERKAAIANVTDAADAVTAEKATVDSGAVAAAAAEVAAQSKSLVFTTGVDNLLGSVGNDTFNGAVNKANDTGSTAQPGDLVTGGAGTDTLNIAIAGDGGGLGHTVQAITTTGVENLLVSNYDTNASETTIDTSLMTGLANIGVQSTGANGNTTFSGMTSIVDATMKNGSSNLTLTYVAGTTGTADTQNVAIGGLTAGTLTANGLETISLTGALSASKMTNVTGTGTTGLTISGDQNFTMSGTSTIKTIDASANTGKTSLVVGAAAANAGSTVTLGSGNDTLDVGTSLNALDKIQGGDGIDTIKLSVGNQTVNGGTTTVATSEFVQSGGFEIIEIASTNNAATLSVKDIPGVTNVEAKANTKVVQFTGLTNNTTAETVAFTINGVAGVTATAVDFTETNAATETTELGTKFAAAVNAMTGLTAVHDGTGGVTVTNTSTTTDRLDIAITAGSANTFTEATGNYNTFTVSGITDQAVDIYTAGQVTARLVDSSGAADSLSVNLKSGLGDRSAAQTVSTLNIADTIETLNLSSTGMKAGTQKTLTTLTADNNLTTLNLTGSDKLTIGTLTAAKLATIDASAYTGDLSIPGVAGALSQAITTGSGNDTLVLSTGLAAGDVIDGGGNTTTAAGTAGKDTATLTANLGGIVAAIAPTVSNVEQVNQAIGTNAATYLDGTNLTNVGEWAFSSTTGPIVLTNMPAGMEIGLGTTTDEAVADITYTLADATGTEDALTLDFGDLVDTAAAASIKTTDIETLNIKATKESAGADTFSLDVSKAGAATINVSEGHAADTLALGTLSASTTSLLAGSAKNIVTATAAALSPGMTVTAAAAVVNNITGSTKADTFTLSGKMADVRNVLDAGGSATGTVDVFNGTMTGTATDFTSFSGFETLNLTVPAATATGLDNALEDAALQAANSVNILGGNSNSSFTVTGAEFTARSTAATALNLDMSGFGGTTRVQFAVDSLNAFTTVTGSPQADRVDTIVAAAVGATANNPTMSGVERLSVTTVDTDVDGSMSFAKVTDLTRLDLTYVGATADAMAFTGLAAGIPIYLTSNVTNDKLTATLASASGTADALSMVVLSNAGTFDIDSAGIEALSIVTTAAAAANTFDLAGVSPTVGSTSTLTVSGPQALTIANLHTGFASINAAANSGGLTLASANRDADVLTVTGGPSSDSIAMENVADVLDGGTNPTSTITVGDTLEIVSSAILGGITVDLSATDQVTTMDGGANAAVQQGFEHVDLRGFANFGAVVTGSAGVNVITGTASADRINAGKGDDLIQIALTGEGDTDQFNGGAGTDTISNLAGTFAPANGTITSVEIVTGANGTTVSYASQTGATSNLNGTNAGVQTFTPGQGTDVINISGGGNDIILYSNVNQTGTVTAGAGTTTAATIDKITVAANDVINLQAILDSHADYDAFENLVNSGNVTITGLTGGAGSPSKVGRIAGTYDAATDVFTIANSGINAIMLIMADDDGTTATDSVLLLGVTNVTSMTNGIITV